MDEILNKVETAIEYEFINKNLLLTALTHRSYRERVGERLVQASNYERLEFLGDAVLELIVTEYLYQNFQKNEGELTSIRSQVVNRFILAKIGQDLGLDLLVRISEQEKAEVGKARDSITADAVEAVIGAVYTEAGYTITQAFVLRVIIPEIEDLLANKELKDPKTSLQELTQKLHKVTPQYKTLETRGKDHQKEFECAVVVDGNQIASAWGKSKQEAQTEAAKQALIVMQESKDLSPVQPLLVSQAK